MALDSQIVSSMITIYTTQSLGIHPIITGNGKICSFKALYTASLCKQYGKSTILGFLEWTEFFNFLLKNMNSLCSCLHFQTEKTRQVEFQKDIKYSSECQCVFLCMLYSTA